MEHLPIQLSAASGVPYYRQIVDQVALLVRSGQLLPNTRLPSVRELAGGLLVSLITIRRAYADLETAGLIVRLQGQGTYVAENVRKASREQALSETRDLLRKGVTHGKRHGLNKKELRAMLDDLLARDGESDGKP